MKGNGKACSGDGAIEAFFPKISDRLWDGIRSIAGSIIPDTDNTRPRGRGRPSSDPRELFDIIVVKLRTGTTWHQQGKAGTTAFNLHKTITKAGLWDSLWRLIMADGTLALTEAEKRAATEWQIREGYLSGAMGDWLPPEQRTPKEEKPPSADPQRF